jgi:hypothetical protein
MDILTWLPIHTRLKNHNAADTADITTKDDDIVYGSTFGEWKTTGTLCVSMVNVVCLLPPTSFDSHPGYSWTAHISHFLARR